MQCDAYLLFPAYVPPTLIKSSLINVGPASPKWKRNHWCWEWNICIDSTLHWVQAPVVWMCFHQVSCFFKQKLLIEPHHGVQTNLCVYMYRLINSRPGTETWKYDLAVLQPYFFYWRLCPLLEHKFIIHKLGKWTLHNKKRLSPFIAVTVSFAVGLKCLSLDQTITTNWW